jgi:hypothetical protein
VNSLIESLVETYNTFVEFVECPGKSGYMAVLCKVKPESRELIKSKLLDSWGRVDKDLYKVIKRMRKVMGWYDDDQPDGIKK